MRLLLDANVTILLAVGRVAPRLIKQHKRLGRYGLRDFKILNDFVAQADVLLVTPNTMTETSNLAVSGILEPDRSKVARMVAELVRVSAETYVRSAEAVDHASYERLGLTDAALLLIDDDDVILLTADQDLYSEACRSAGGKAVWFEMLRSER